MTDKEIVKALERIYKKVINIKDTQIVNVVAVKKIGDIIKASLNIINKQQAEIERLQNRNCETTDYFSKLLEETKKKGKLTGRIAEEEAVKEFEKRVLSLFPADKDFTTISRFSVKKISKEMIKVIKE